MVNWIASVIILLGCEKEGWWGNFSILDKIAKKSGFHLRRHLRHIARA
jgi:hypothetical protein